VKYKLIIILLLTGCAAKQEMAVHPVNVVEVEEKPDVILIKKHLLTAEVAKVAAEKLATGLEKYSMKWSWDKEKGQIKYHVDKGILVGVNGSLILENDKVKIKVFNLPSFLIPFKEMVLSRIKQRVDMYFGNN